MNSILVGLILYLGIVLYIGFRSIGQNRTHADYLIASRKLGPWAIALSERASGESAWLLIGLPGAALAVGFLEIWAAVGCVAGIIFSWLFLAVPLRKLADDHDSMTVPDLIATYFGQRGQYLRIPASLIITFFFTFYVAAQFNAAGKVLNVTFGLPHFIGMCIGAGIILLYTILGGFRAVVWTDMVQALIMICTLVILPVVGIFEVLHTPAGQLHSFTPSVRSLTGGNGGLLGFLAILSGLSWGLGYTGQPHLLMRFLAIRRWQAIRRGRAVAISWAIPAFFGAFFMGIVGYRLMGPAMFSDPEFLMPYLAKTLLPGWFAGILISGAMAAMMSTADSQLLVTASAVSEDLIHKVGKRELTPARLLTIGRWATVVVGLLAFLLAYTSTELVFALVSYAWSGLGASFGPVLLCMIYWKRITARGALAGMLTGALVTIIWRNITILNNAVSERLASFILAFAAIVIVSLLKRKEER